MRFNGTLFDGKTARAIPVSIHVEGWILRIIDDDGTLRHDVSLDKCSLVPPLGSTRRSLFLPDGTRIDTDDHEAMAALDQKAGTNQGLSLVNAIESKWHLALASTLVLLIFVWLFIQHGIPAMAEQMARNVPMPVLEAVSDKALAQLDARFLQPTELDGETQSAAGNVFSDVADAMGGQYNYRLLHRSGPLLGANALALPSGEIVVTDALINLADSDQEIAGVFAHEMAHVKERHGMRMAFQRAGVFFLVSMLVGDVVSITSIAAALPTMLVESGYSREFEREADDAAARYLIDRDLGTGPLRAMLQRLLDNQGDAGVLSMIATHPATRDRIERLKKFEEIHSARHGAEH